MALRFYFDTHIAKAVAEQLRRQGVDVVRCEEVGLAEASDNVHLTYATQERRILVSQDADVIILDSRWHQSGRQHGGIMKVPGDLSGEAQLSHLVKWLAFYHDAE
jgi:hypothetical protein